MSKSDKDKNDYQSSTGKSFAGSIVGVAGSTPGRSTPSLRLTPTRGGTLGGSAGRLPSFRPPRDLTLCSPSSRGGGAASVGGRGGRSATSEASKKKFVPNLNVQRRDLKPPPSVKTEQPKNHQNAHFKSAATPPGRRGGSHRSELIQMIGSVFSDGMGSVEMSSTQRRNYGGNRESSGAGSGSSGFERPKINLKHLESSKFDKAAEEERLKELLRDDFIDDLKTGSLVPIQLPMISTGNAFKEELEDEDEDEVNIMRQSVTGNKATKKLKKNVIRDDSDDDEDMSSGQVKKVKERKRESKAEEPAQEMSFTKLISGQSGELLFLQLPDRLPVVTDDLKRHTDLLDLPEGYLGKLQIRASGKTQLLIGDMALDVHFGTQVGFLQEAISVNIPSTRPPAPTHAAAFPQRDVGDLTVLGRVRHRVIVTPDWNTLFKHEASPDVDESSSDDDDDAKVVPPTKRK